jgi:hypothetical protein
MNVLTFNLWDAPIVCKSRVERITRFCDLLEKNVAKYDIVALQEVYNNDTRKALEAAAYKGGLRHVRHFSSGTCLPQGARGCG